MVIVVVIIIIVFVVIFVDVVVCGNIIIFIIRLLNMSERMRGVGHAENDSSVLLWIADRHVSGATSSI